jgi:hypothetical protein
VTLKKHNSVNERSDPSFKLKGEREWSQRAGQSSLLQTHYGENVVTWTPTRTDGSSLQMYRLSNSTHF